MSDNEKSDSGEIACLRCEGTKVIVHKAFTSLDGKDYPETRYPCHCCNGRGVFPPIDKKAVLSLLIATKGKNKGRIRAAMTSPFSSEGVNASRAYYVWRIARFHGGKDMTMPMTADMIVRGDPFKKELDAMADQVAKAFFGTDMAAALRWGQAMGII